MEDESPRVVLLDEGELDDVRARLRDLDVAQVHARHATVGEPVPLLISTPEHARALAAGEADAPPCQLHVVIGEAGGERVAPPALHLVRPIDAAVLRWLTRREPHPGREGRLATRFSLGFPVKIRIGDERREVIVANLSVGGCGLVSPIRLRAGSTVEITLAPDTDARPELVLTGVVRSCQPLTTADGETWDASIAFDPLDGVDRVTLRTLMARDAIDYRPDPDGSGRIERGLRERVQRGDVERRAQARHRFRRRVMSVHDGVAEVWMARDLSREGVRVEASRRLRPGDEYTLAIFGSHDAAPVRVDATVAREDDLEGLYLRFAGCSPDVSERIETLIDTLVPLDVDGPDA